MRDNQTGVTLIGFIMILALLIFFGYLGMRLFPIYSEYYSVKQAMEALAREPGISQTSPAKVRDLLFRRFNVSYVDSVENKDVKISKRSGYTLQVAYEVRKPLLGNLDVVASFDETVDLLAHDR